MWFVCVFVFVVFVCFFFSMLCCSCVCFFVFFLCLCCVFDFCVRCYVHDVRVLSYVFPFLWRGEEVFAFL